MEARQPPAPPAPAHHLAPLGSGPGHALFLWPRPLQGGPGTGWVAREGQGQGATMAEDGVLLSESSSDGGRSQPRRRRKRRRLEIIDLTGEDCFVVRSRACDDFGVIDLTQAEETMVSPLHNGGYSTEDLKHPFCAQPLCSPNIFTPTDAKIKLDVTVDMWDRDCKPPYSEKQAMSEFYFQTDSFSLTNSYGADSESSSHTTYNSDLGSLGSPQLESDIFSFSSANEESEYQGVLDCMEEDPSLGPSEGQLSPKFSPSLQKLSSNLIPVCSSTSNSTSPTELDQPLLEINNPAPSTAKSDLLEAPKQIDIKAWLKTLQYFQSVPVHHPFLQNVVQEMRQNRQLKAQPIPSRRLSIISSTIEENFFQGTLDFLMDYVSSQHYPSKEIITSVVEDILLNRDQDDVQQEMQKDAYLLLMKIQALHPANAEMMAWDWKLLRLVMEEEENKFPGRLFFLQYVIQTLEDDFQRMAKQAILKKSIAKTVLSCDHCFSNVKDVIEWLVAAVTGVKSSQYRRQLQEAGSPLSETAKGKSGSFTPELHLDQTAQEVVSSQCQTKTEVALLQKMLSIAVEVDASPYCSANKIADRLFSYLLYIPKRCQREAFLISMECDLLRCKVLELIFQHSSAPTTLPLSLTKILHFLKTFSLQLIYQDNEATWQKWDEMLHHLNLLLLSYRNVVLRHLRISISDRIPLISKAVKPKLQQKDYIDEHYTKCNIQRFQEHLSHILGQPIPSPILEKIELLQVLLHTPMES